MRASVLCPGAVNTDISRNSIANPRARRGQETGRTPEGDKLSRRMADALAGDMDPDEVGHRVLDGILNDTFWMFTDPRRLRHVQEQVEVMVNDRRLTRPRLF